MTCPPGYGCDLLARDDGSFMLEVTHKGKVLLRKAGTPGASMKAYLDYAAKIAHEAYEKHRADNPTLPSGAKSAWAACTPKQLAVLKRNGHKEAELRLMPYGRAKILVGQYLASYYGRK